MEIAETYCDSEEEVFFGPITVKEIKKALTLRRKTEVYRPMLSCEEIQEDVTEGKIGKKERSLKNLTFTPQPSKLSKDLSGIWKRKSLSFHPAQHSYDTIDRSGDAKTSDTSDDSIDSETCELFDENRESEICDAADEDRETPAPPPSPEFSRYNGSPYPTPSYTRRHLCNSLRDIAEEEGNTSSEMKNPSMKLSFFPRYSDMEQFGERRDTDAFSYSSQVSNDSLSILSKLDDNLVEETSKLSLLSSMVCKDSLEVKSIGEAVGVENENENCLDLQTSLEEEERKTRDLLIEKMKKHEEITQQLRGTKKHSANMHNVTSTDDVIILNDVGNNFSLDGENLASSNQILDKEIEILSEDNFETSICESSVGNIQTTNSGTPVTSEKSENCRYSRLISERDLASSESCLPLRESVREHETSIGQSVFLNDFERRYGKEKIDEALAVMNSQIELQTKEVDLEAETDVPEEVNTAACYSPDEDMTPVRPSSPEFDIEIPVPKTSTPGVLPGNVSYAYIAADYSLISEAEESLELYSTDKSDMETERNSANLQNSVENTENAALVIADEDGGFLSVLSEAALYHASLKQQSNRDLDVRTSNSNDNVEQMEDLVVNIDDDSLCRRHYSSVEEFEEQQEAPECNVSHESSLRNENVAESENNLIIQQCSAHNNSLDSHESSVGREMDATSDLNENDKRNMEDVKGMESCSEEEGFHDTLEEMEMLMKFGIDYMMSSNDIGYTSKCSDITEIPCFTDSMSTPKKLTDKEAGFEDFGVSVEHENQYCLTNNDNCTKVATEVFVPKQSNENLVPLINVEDHQVNVTPKGPYVSVPSSLFCDNSETCISENDVHVKLFPKPETTPLKRVTQNKVISSSKIQTIISPNVNAKHCQSIKRNENPSPFKIPVKPVDHGIHIPKLGSIRSAKKSPLKPITPCKKLSNYHKIISPVGAYIHNTPSPSLVKIVKPKPYHTSTPKRMGKPTHDSVSEVLKTNLEVLCEMDKGTENVDMSNIRPILPLVTYKSVPSVKLDEPQLERLPHMNEKMKKLVDTPRPIVIRHEGRVKVTPSSRVQSAAASVKKLVTHPDDSYVASSDADGEISVVVQKQVARTNTLGFKLLK